ncbi:MAG: hypothetical protein QG635_2252, partial [Bacteroidota bacterium]|nr:hypothetical protein [Bacteroidota bacterium]
KGIIIDCNLQLAEMLGYERSELIGMEVISVVAPESIDIVLNHIKSSSEEAYENILLNKDRTKIIVETQAKSLPYKGRMMRVTAIRDITERKQAEELLQKQNMELEAQYEEYMQLNEVLRQTNYELEIAKAKAEESDNLKTAFLQNMSHEIRTPLNGIIGFSNLLTGDDLTAEEINEFTDMIQQSGQRLIEIVNNVLDISKIETGQIEVNQKSFVVNTLVRDLHGFFGPVTKAKDIKFSYHCCLDDNHSYLFSDEAKLNQILTNLLSNAIKFTNSGSIDIGYEINSKIPDSILSDNTKLSESLKLSESNITFYVKDTGIGIPPEFQEKIFDRFIQAEQSITRGYEGAGLGLAICRGLVELLGGKLWLESELNKGTAFFFTLPYISSPRINTLSESLKLSESSKTSENYLKGKILVAEDDMMSYLFLSKLLQKSDIDVIHAKNGQKAIEIVKSTPDLNLILMDIRMPVLDGMEATKQIKQIRPDLPIVAQTAYAFTEEKEKILSAGCDDYISKPIIKDILMKLIEKYM